MKKTFDQTIYHKWTNSFGCSTETAFQTGTTIVPESRYEGRKAIILQYIGSHTFAQIDPFYFQVLNNLVQGLPGGVSIDGSHIQSAWDAKDIDSHDFGLSYYLHPSDLPAHLPPAPFSIRKLTVEDAAAMTALQQACSTGEVQEADVEVTYQISFGCFHEGALVAAASGYELRGFLDIGVLTHPGFRKKGLGRAAVGALCEWAIKKHIILQYRHDVTNVNSQRLVQSLNFKQYFKTEAFIFR